MKRNILFFILGGIFFSCISVYATITYQASQINYNNTTLDHVLDDLYSASNAQEYSGSTSFIPSDNSQIISTKGKLLTSDITIFPIPTSYHNLASTSALASDIISGKTAYNGYGELLTGTHVDCTGGSVTLNSNVTTSAGQQVLNYWPKTFLVYRQVPNSGGYEIFYYNSSITGANSMYRFNTLEINNNSTSSFKVDEIVKYKLNNTMTFHDFANSSWIGTTWQYMACK